MGSEMCIRDSRNVVNCKDAHGTAFAPHEVLAFSPVLGERSLWTDSWVDDSSLFTAFVVKVVNIGGVLGTGLVVCGNTSTKYYINLWHRRWAGNIEEVV